MLIESAGLHLRVVKGGGGGLDHVSREKNGPFTIHEKQRQNENHGSRRIKHLFLVSRKIILQNHASRLLWKSRFTRKKLAISHFTGKKRADHESRKYPLPSSSPDLTEFYSHAHLCSN